ncbi:LacI family transcriptional regulator [Pseudaminobacter salicylatoxidans]|uniref:LacI family transcriptional regulator n=1 Tax=Pseudaminobacter salicylatoxidans TaxID=93369 RepID=A0A316C7U5_PSESE|nr:LacI family transcriptional regulator [Pseudaminobacter salicylatoxidans]PWJ85730.1 LacI family transcriptional regulator [Pseudaminobacter salicylatoxidans]
MDGNDRNGRRETGDETAAKPTLRTIAEITGLAVTTVSRALGGAPQIALETRRKVRQVAEEIGYLPDRAAQRLRTGRTNVVTLVLDPHEEILGFSTSLIRGLTEALRDTSYHLVITPHFANVPSLDPVRHIMRNKMADGIVFSRTEPFDERVKLLIEHDFPFICHGRTELGTPHAYVDFDNFTFAYQATKRLIARGAKRLAIILPPRRFTFFQHVQYGFMSAVRESGVAFEIIEDVDLDSPATQIQASVFARMGEPSAPDGYVCGGEVSALAIMAAISDRGLRPGVDIGIVAKQTSGLFNLVRPQVDTIYEDIADAGLNMGRMLLAAIGGRDPADLHMLQAPQLNFVAPD